MLIRHSPPLGCVLLFLLLTCLAAARLAGRCPFGISPETAQRIFDRMKQVPAGDGYRFEGVSTNKTEMAVLWSLDGKACPPIQVIIEGCTPLLGLPALQLDVPPELLASCPGLEAVVKGLSNALPAEHPVGQSPFIPLAALPAFIAVIGLVVVAGLLIRRLLTPTAGKAGWGDIGWIALRAGGGDSVLLQCARRRDGGVGGHVGDLRRPPLRARPPRDREPRTAAVAARALLLLAAAELVAVVGRPGRSAPESGGHLVLRIGAALGAGAHRALSSAGIRAWEAFRTPTSSGAISS